MDPIEPKETVAEIRVPLKEEELSVTKRRESAGEIKIRKRVVTEPRTLTARIAVETVHIDRVPGDEMPGRFDEDPSAFKEETIVVPLRREEVELHKRVVVREEIRIAKSITVERREVVADVRREELDVDREGETSPH